MFGEAVEFWHWWVLAIVLIGIEIFAPGAYFMWLGVSAGLVGFLLLAVPGAGWEYQLLAFAVLAVASVAGWRAYQRRHPGESDHPTLNRRGAQYIGRVFTLDAPIVNGAGKLRVDDTTWKIVGQDLPAAAHVRVTGVDGTVLTVEPA